jgi:hypothetical protein
VRDQVSIIDGERYIDSEYLEQHEFNVEGRQRFYAIPDADGRLVNVEREKGINQASLQVPSAPTELIALAKNYQRVSAGELQQLTGQQCLSAKALKGAKRLGTEPLDLWPRPSFEPRFDFVLAEFKQPVQDIRLMSYASGRRHPTFYWPLPIFLDQKGCVLEGVMSYQQSQLAATVLQQSALLGTLHVPQGAGYLLLTPLAEAADMPQVKLSDQGQLRLVPLRQSSQP